MELHCVFSFSVPFMILIMPRNLTVSDAVVGVTPLRAVGKIHLRPAVRHNHPRTLIVSLRSFLLYALETIFSMVFRMD